MVIAILYLFFDIFEKKDQIIHETTSRHRIHAAQNTTT